MRHKSSFQCIQKSSAFKGLFDLLRGDHEVSFINLMKLDHPAPRLSGLN